MFQELNYVKFIETEVFHVDEMVYFLENDVKRYQQTFESEGIMSKSKRGDINHQLMMDVCFVHKYYLLLIALGALLVV